MDQACEAEPQAKAAKAYATQQNYCGNTTGAALAGYGMEQPRPDTAFALDGAAAIVRTLETFYPPFILSRPLTRAEKLAALRAAIVAYEHLNW